MKNKIATEIISKILYEDAYLDLTYTQIEELIDNFPSEMIKGLEKAEEGVIKQEGTRRAILNQFSLFLTGKEWPYYVDSDDHREAWNVQMRAAFDYRGYKIRKSNIF